MYCTEGILHLIYISQNHFFVLHYYEEYEIKNGHTFS